MNIFVMRHGHAERRAATDAQRPLSDLGKQEVLTIAPALQNYPYLRLLVSPYVRAVQTADLVQQLLEDKRTIIHRESLDCLTPESDPQLAVDYLAQTKPADTLIVAHQPLVGCLVQWMVEGVMGAGPGYSTAAIGHLEAELAGPGLATFKGFLQP